MIIEEGELKKSVKTNKRVIKREESLAVFIKKSEGLGMTQCAGDSVNATGFPRCWKGTGPTGCCCNFCFL